MQTNQVVWLITMTEYNIKKKIQEINRIELEIKRQKEKDRKERTRRLIQKGALLEKYFDLESTSVDETEIFLKELKKKGS